MLFEDPLKVFGTLGPLSLFILSILLIFSVVSWAIIFYKWWSFRIIERAERSFLNVYGRLPRDYEELRFQAQELEASPSAAIFLGVIDRFPSSHHLFHTAPGAFDPSEPFRTPDGQYLEKVTQYIVQNHINRQESYLPFLATTGNLTPFIGLLGTVLGIINSFHEIGTQGSASIAAVAPGVAEALVATAAGLFAAIPAVIGYNFFLTKIRRSMFRVEAFSIEFLNTIEERTKESHEVEVSR